jgi:hypothetical protein
MRAEERDSGKEALSLPSCNRLGCDRLARSFLLLLREGELCH